MQSKQLFVFPGDRPGWPSPQVLERERGGAGDRFGADLSAFQRKPSRSERALEAMRARLQAAQGEPKPFPDEAVDQIAAGWSRMRDGGGSSLSAWFKNPGAETDPAMVGKRIGDAVGKMIDALPEDPAAIAAWLREGIEKRKPGTQEKVGFDRMTNGVAHLITGGSQILSGVVRQALDQRVPGKTPAEAIQAIVATVLPIADALVMLQRPAFAAQAEAYLPDLREALGDERLKAHLAARFVETLAEQGYVVTEAQAERITAVADEIGKELLLAAEKLVELLKGEEPVRVTGFVSALIDDAVAAFELARRKEAAAEPVVSEPAVVGPPPVEAGEPTDPKRGKAGVQDGSGDRGEVKA